MRVEDFLLFSSSNRRIKREKKGRITNEWIHVKIEWTLKKIREKHNIEYGHGDEERKRGNDGHADVKVINIQVLGKKKSNRRITVRNERMGTWRYKICRNTATEKSEQEKEDKKNVDKDNTKRKSSVSCLFSV